MTNLNKQNKKKTIVSPENKSGINVSNMNGSVKTEPDAKTEPERSTETEGSIAEQQTEANRGTEKITAEQQTEATRETEKITAEQQTEATRETEKITAEQQTEELKKNEKFNLDKEEHFKPPKKDRLDFEQKVKILVESLAQQKDQFMRLAAEFDNYKKRQQQRTISDLQYAVESIAKDLFSVTDSLENALKHVEQEKDDSRLEEFVQGIKLVQQQFLNVFKQHHIKRFLDLGEVFNPERHEAVGTLETKDAEPNQVVDVFTPGYLLHDKVIRAAMVQVSKRKE